MDLNYPQVLPGPVQAILRHQVTLNWPSCPHCPHYGSRETGVLVSPIVKLFLQKLESRYWFLCGLHSEPLLSNRSLFCSVFFFLRHQFTCIYLLIYFIHSSFIYFAVLRMEPKALKKLGKSSTTELHPALSFLRV
jgi:hypothetical protein